MWRHLVSTVFEPTMPSGHSRKDLRAEASAATFGNALIVHAAAESQHFTRSQRLIAGEGMDHYLIQVYRSGVCEGNYGDIRNTVHPGDIKIIDLARPFNTLNTDFDNITLTLPRAMLAPLLARPDSLHGRVLHRDTAHARLLSSISRRWPPTPRTSVRQMGTTSPPPPCGWAREEAAIQMANATGGSIRQFVGRNLASSDLLPDSLARRFRMSRAYLYRLFANDGGVQAYIRAQRLRRCFQAIVDPTNHARGIGDIALSFGFVSEAHFSRVFRQEFGLNPTDARAQAAIPPPTG